MVSIWVMPDLSSLLFSQGPCRRHMEASLQELKASPRMVPRAVYLPNCDRKGFYKRKQVRAVPLFPAPGWASPLGLLIGRSGVDAKHFTFLTG